jgi:hypothetical protein
MLQRLIENTPNDVYYHDKSSDKKEVRICTENNRCNYYLNGITYKYESTCINENCPGYSFEDCEFWLIVHENGNTQFEFGGLPALKEYNIIYCFGCNEKTCCDMTYDYDEDCNNKNEESCDIADYAIILLETLYKYYHIGKEYTKFRQNIDSIYYRNLSKI